MKWLPTLAAGSFDCVITDPPYPEIDRPYGRWTEDEWWELMMGVCREVRRVLKPTGSAVFILQPNSRKVGSMRGWLFRFQSWVCECWNMPQDAYWWNFARCPTVHCQRQYGLMRPSVKACVWAGPADCYRNQDGVLWSESEGNAAVSRGDRALRRHPSGNTMNKGRCASVADERGGVTPFNLLPVANIDGRNGAGAYGHGAGTPDEVVGWWARYICPPGGAILDPFAGSGTTGLAALAEGRSAVLVERSYDYCNIIRSRLAVEE